MGRYPTICPIFSAFGQLLTTAGRAVVTAFSPFPPSPPGRFDASPCARWAVTRIRTWKCKLNRRASTFPDSTSAWLTPMVAA